MISGRDPALTNPPPPAYQTPARVEYETTAMIAPKDRIRFGPVIAGLCAMITVLVTLGLFGAALGLTTLDADSSRNNPGGFAAIWAALSALIAFYLGGSTAGWAMAMPGKRNGAANGAMVFMVAVPILLWLAVSGVGTVLGTFRDIAVAGISALPAAAEVAQDAVAGNPALQATAQAGATLAAPAAATAVATAVEGLQNVPPAQVEQAARTAGEAAWVSLLSLGLGLLAATIGGWVGARSSDVDIVTDQSMIRR